MIKNKYFTQYADEDIAISLGLCPNGTFRNKSSIRFKKLRRNGQKRYSQTEEGKITKAKVSAKRREFGYNPLNKRFENSEAHHIDSINIIHIPKEIHRSIWHSQSKLDTMIEINKLAWEYLKLEQTPTPIYLCPA